MRFFKYFQSAFLYHWNLLAFGGAAALALMTRPDIGLPLVAAAEIAYLSLLGTHPRFKKYVDAHEAKAARAQAQGTASRALDRILGELPPNALARFEALRGRCADLRAITAGLHAPTVTGETAPLDELQEAGLDHLLWTFLRLLYTQHMLGRFLDRTDEHQIRRTLDNLRQSLHAQTFPTDDPQRQKIRQSLEDNIRTSEERLANRDKARAQSEFVRLEIDRLENKIQSLCEMGVNRQESGGLASEVDVVASGMAQTERAIGELRFATGLEDDDEVPRLLQRTVH